MWATTRPKLISYDRALVERFVVRDDNFFRVALDLGPTFSRC